MRCRHVGNERRDRNCSWIGAFDVDGKTGDLLGLIVCQRNDDEVWSRANQTHEYATLVVARDLRKRLVWAQRDRDERRHVPAVLERHNEENVVGINATMLSREARDG